MVYLIAIFLLISIIMFCLSYNYFNRKTRLLKLCTETTTGELKGPGTYNKITNIGEAEYTIHGGPAPFAYYNVNGKKYKVQYSNQIIKATFDNRVSLKNDVSPKQVVIKYFKDNPKIAYIDGDDLSGNKFMGYAFLLMGILFLLMEIFPIMQIVNK